MTDTDAPRCIVCRRRELADDEPQTCRPCIAQVRKHLQWIVRLYALLPVELEGRTGKAPSMRGGRSGDDSGAVPMGELLALMGPGGRGYGGPADTPSVAWSLASWEDDWRDFGGHGGAPYPASVDNCADYLLDHLGTYAQRHPAFDDFAAEMRQLLGKLRAALQMLDNPLPMGADCFECGDRLVRDYAPPMPCRHDGSHQPSCDQGGLRDHVRCEGCGRSYTPAQYLLALRSAIEVASQPAA